MYYLIFYSVTRISLFDLKTQLIYRLSSLELWQCILKLWPKKCFCKFFEEFKIWILLPWVTWQINPPIKLVTSLADSEDTHADNPEISLIYVARELQYRKDNEPFISFFYITYFS